MKAKAPNNKYDDAIIKRKSIKAFATRVYDGLPHSLPLLVIIFSSFVVVLVVVGLLSIYTLILIATPLSVIAYLWLFNWGTTYNRPKKMPEYRWSLFFLLLYCIVWLFMSWAYVQDDIFTYRDNAVYKVTAGYYGGNKGIKLPDYLVDNKNVTNIVGGFGHYPAQSSDGDNTEVTYHGSAILPGLVASLGKIGGVYASFKTNLLLAAIALLAVFGVSATLMRPIFALLPALLLSISLPFLYYSRDIYTELISMVFVLAVAGLMLHMLKFGADKKLSILTGFVLGASILARIDALLYIFPLLSYLIIISKINYKNKKFSNSNLRYIIVSFAITFALSTFSILHTSRGYLLTHSKLILAEVVAGVALMCLSYVFVIFFVRYKLFNKVKEYLHKPEYYVASLVVVGMLLLAARTMWYPGFERMVSFKNIGGREVVLQNSLDGGGIVYNSKESIVAWIFSYVGIVVALSAFAGLTIFAYRAIKYKQIENVMILFLALPVTIVYLVFPFITPDHIWAIRRLLPVTIPFVFIFSGYFTYIVFKQNKFRKMGPLVVVVIIILSFYSVFSISKVVIKNRLNQGHYSQLINVCERLPNNAVVVWGGSMGYEAIHPTKAYCHIDSVRLNDYSQAELSKVAKDVVAVGKVPILGYVAPQNMSDDIDSANFTFINSLKYDDIKKVLYEAPDEVITSERSIVLGVIQEDGKVEPF